MGAPQLHVNLMEIVRSLPAIFYDPIAVPTGPFVRGGLSMGGDDSFLTRGE